MSGSRRGLAGAKSPPMRTNLDEDWETDPDFVRDMDETDQRWGSKRTVGSINMNELIDEVRKDHKIMREKFDHPSQRDHSEGFGGKFGIQHDRKDQSAHDYDYHEELSKHTSQEISRKVITSSSSATGKGNGISDVKRTFLERAEDTFQKSRPQVVPKPAEFKTTYSRTFKPTTTTTNLGTRSGSGLDRASSTSPRFEESSTRQRVISEEKRSSSSASRGGPSDPPPAFKSIQEKIDAFKKEFEDIENKVNKKSDLGKIIKKSTNVEKSSNVEYVSRNPDDTNAKTTYSPTAAASASSSRPTSTSPSSGSYSRSSTQRAADLPKANIKSLSEKFETLCREDSEDFRRRTEARRKEFFNEIKNQVRETRKELDGFDPIDEDYDSIIERKKRENLQSRSSSAAGVTSPGGYQHRSSGPTPTKVFTTHTSTTTPSPSLRSSSRLGAATDGGGSSSQLSSSLGKPKVYTKRETTQEKYVTKFVKEGDKVLVDETQRNVERSSSVHGSSDEDGETTSIRLIDQKLKSSPQERIESPVERLKREIPVVEPEIKGAGLMARTLYDYQAAESDELSFDVDDLITNIDKIDAGWYRGTIVYKDGRKKVGLFPANYVRLLNDTSEY